MKQVKINSDKNVQHILDVGSKKTTYKTTTWIGFQELKTIMLISWAKIIDHDDWALNIIFTCSEWIMGKCTIDRFASHYNNPHEKFNSKVWTPGTERIDAFSQS